MNFIFTFRRLHATSPCIDSHMWQIIFYFIFTFTVPLFFILSNTFPLKLHTLITLYIIFFSFITLPKPHAASYFLQSCSSKQVSICFFICLNHYVTFCPFVAFFFLLLYIVLPFIYLTYTSCNLCLLIH
jgi:hypothetical protein